MTLGQVIDAGKRALGEGRWADARVAFEEALQTEEAPEALFGLGDALWWLGENRKSLEYQERAYGAFRRAGDDANAAMAAINLCFIYHSDLDNRPAARGWVARAERIVETLKSTSMQGWAMLARADVERRDPTRARELAAQALECARTSRDRDLELCALSTLGEVLVSMGMISEGFALVDEAMAGTYGGECDRFETVVFTSCNMMTACEQTADLERVTQWGLAADNFTDTYGSPYLRGRCRVAYGTVLIFTGHWSDAERELATAMQVSQKSSPAVYSQALARLAFLRIRQGRLEEAEDSLAGVSDEIAATLPAALIELARGHSIMAATLLQRRLNLIPDEGCLGTAQTLEALVEARLAQGDLAGATAGAERLVVQAEQSGLDLVAARAAHAKGLVTAAKGELDNAVAHLEEALERFLRLRLPWEAAHVRVELSSALKDDRPEVAVAEARRALASFEQMGAAGAADTVAALLRSLGVSGRTGPKDVGVLSKREQEVLRLVGLGLSNPEIADRLFITRKTASHHVSNVLSKLGLRNRAEAAAYVTSRTG